MTTVSDSRLNSEVDGHVRELVASILSVAPDKIDEMQLLSLYGITSVGAGLVCLPADTQTQTAAATVTGWSQSFVAPAADPVAPFLPLIEQAAKGGAFARIPLSISSIPDGKDLSIIWQQPPHPSGRDDHRKRSAGRSRRDRQRVQPFRGVPVCRKEFSKSRSLP